MFLQRLIADHREDGCGLNYDYMGSAEFEFGVTGDARRTLAMLAYKDQLGCNRVHLFERWGMTTHGPTDAYLFGEKAYIKTIVTKPTTKFLFDSLLVTADKESARINDPKYLGWMEVFPRGRGENPILIIRPEALPLADTFLNQFIDEIERREKASEKCAMYQFEKDWSLRRVRGPVYLPQNDGIPIEGDGQWVLFDPDNKAQDRDKYFTDIVDRNYRRTGDIVPAEN